METLVERVKVWWGWFRCEKLDWHTPRQRSMTPNPASANGYDAVCERCCWRLLMDSQGCWFRVETRW